MAIIEKCIAKAQNDADPSRTQINWAHLLIATLVHHGYVKQILTTNFDPLLVDAMAITDQPVRTFDLTAADWYMPGRATRGSIMYLHGQAHGLLQSHTSDETARVGPRIRAVLQEALQDSTMIVVGYSGDCDPVFNELRDEFPQFRNRLYWVHYDPENKEPSKHLINFIETPTREAFLLVDDDESWLDADTAMHRIAVKGLQLALLPLVSNPLDHARQALARLCGGPKVREGQPPLTDPVSAAKDLVERAEACVRGKKSTDSGGAGPPSPDEDEPIEDLGVQVELAGMTGDVANLRRLRPSVEAKQDPDLISKLGTAFLAGASLALHREDAESAIPLLEEAQELGATEQHWVLVSWGNALATQAAKRDGKDANDLFEEAYAKYAGAVRIKPDMHHAFYNWGGALAKQAENNDGKDADDLFAEAYTKLAEAVRLKPDWPEAINNCGMALAGQANKKDGKDADDLFAEAYTKFAEAVRLKPDWFDAFNNWGIALANQAKNKDGKDADDLFAEAYTKYAEAVRLKPDWHGAFTNWGVALAAQAKKTDAKDADDLFEEASAKYAQALRVEPNTQTVFFNIACLQALRARASASIEWLRRWADSAPTASRAKVDHDTDFDLIRNDPEFQGFLESLPS